MARSLSDNSRPPSQNCSTRASDNRLRLVDEGGARSNPRTGSQTARILSRFRVLQQNLLKGGGARQADPSGWREHYQHSQPATTGVETLGQYVEVFQVQPNEGRLSGRGLSGSVTEIDQDTQAHQDSNSDAGESAA